MQIIESIPFNSLPFHGKLVKDYLMEAASLKPFYHQPPSLQGILETAKERVFSDENRGVLVGALLEQYGELLVESEVKNNIEKLRLANTFTITTGHQLCAYGGPAYFIYKICSAINLAKQLTTLDPSRNFVPVFWMASEDHDFDEISEVNFFGKSWKWEKENDEFGKVPVGIISPHLLSTWAEEMRSYFRADINTDSLLQIFESAYKNNSNLSDATRQIIHELFKDFGLVVIDGNDKKLKQLFVPVMLDEVFTKSSHSAVSSTTLGLQNLGYNGQVSSREVNLFYFTKVNHRIRIETKENGFQLPDQQKEWNQDEIIDEIKSNPERFSPNVVLRPVYQETILPNIAYIGGPAEVAYWLQLKQVFLNFNTSFPVILVRSSFAFVPEVIIDKFNKYRFSWTEYFTKSLEELNAQFIQSENSETINFEEEDKLIDSIFVSLNTKAEELDKQLLTYLDMEHKNWKLNLSKIDSKFLKSLKLKSETDLKNLQKIKSVLFPMQILQERKISALDCFGRIKGSISMVISASNSMDNEFKLLKI